jgi:tetratricopeptide (TPR) repeat protein
MRVFSIILLFAFLASSAYGSGSDSFSKRKKGDDNDKEEVITVGMARAWVLFNNNDFYGALRIYRDLYDKAPNNAKLNYRMGICFESLNEKDSAILFLQKAIAQDPEVNIKAYYYLGRSYQYKGKLDQAIEHYYTFKTKDTKERTDVNRLLRQCEGAKYMMSHPVKAEITNAGPSINSKYADASPSITADQQTLIFTTRRPDNVGGQICEFNEQYYDDIYIADWNEQTQSWNEAKNIGEPINTDGFDANLSISPDGQNIFIYKNIPEVTRSGDIYVSSFNSQGKWSKPRAIDEKYINSSFFESSASLTSDGKTLYFVSERERGGFGYGDIWVSHKVAGIWGKPSNIGPVINTEFDEIGVYIHPDGKTLFFSSEGHNSMGMHDIFISTLGEDGQWTKPINLGYPINTTKDEIHFVLSASKDRAYISSNRPEGMGSIDIYEVDMSEYFISNKELPSQVVKEFSSEKMAIIKGTIVDSDSGMPLQAQVKFTNTKSKEKFVLESGENGNYFATVPAGEKFEITVISKGYKSFTFKLKSPTAGAGKTPTETKHVILNKQ